MSWMNLFSKEQFAPYARRIAQRDAVYWQQSLLEEKLSDLKAADRAKGLAKTISKTHAKTAHCSSPLR